VPAANQQRFGGLAAEHSPAAGAAGLGGAASAKSENFLLASWKKTTAAVTGSAAKPTLPEDDPLRLDRLPKKIGPEVYVGAARLLENQGKFDEAEAKYREALKVAPRDLSALIGLARLYDRQGASAKAVEVYRSAAKAHPDNPLVFNDLGLCYRRQRQSAPAIEALRKAVALKPDEAKYRNNLAAALVEAGQTDEALEQLLAVHAPAAAHYNLAYLLQQRGDRQAAATHLHQALQYDPQLAPARQMLAQLGHGAAEASQADSTLAAHAPSVASPDRATASASPSARSDFADPLPPSPTSPASPAPAATAPVAVAPPPTSSPWPLIEYGPDETGDTAFFPPTTHAAVHDADVPPASATLAMPPAAASASQPLPEVQQPAPPSYHIGDEGLIPTEAPGPARYSSAAWVFPPNKTPVSRPPAFPQSPSSFREGQPAGRPLPPVD
jgi:tetratricopeptide (TPR) repeat protein